MTKKKDLTYEENFDKLYQDMINYEEQANMGMMDEAIKDTVKEKGFTKTNLKKQAMRATLKQIGGNHYKDCKIQPIEYIEANNLTYSEGNVRVDNHGSGDASTLSTFGVANGKWYFEAKYSKSPSDAQGYPQLGWAKNGNHNDGEMVGFHTPSGSDYRAKNGSSVISNAFDGVPAANDIIGFYLDLDNSTLIVHQNGSDFMGSGASSGIDFSSTSFDPDTGFFQVRYNSNTNVSHFIEFNFGQPSYSISSANADANGHGSFEYNPTLSSTNYLALCTKNLAETG